MSIYAGMKLHGLSDWLEHCDGVVRYQGKHRRRIC